MSTNALRRASVLAVVAAALSAPAAVAQASETPTATTTASEAGQGSPLEQEWVGIEIAPLSFALGTARDGSSPERARVGLGGTLRLLRHSWTHAYIIPLEAGVFVAGSGGAIILAHVQTEAGVVLTGPLRGLELGMGAGAGILAMSYGNNDCDGSCNLGGAGPLLSPVVRYLLGDGPRFTMGVTVRAVIPLHVPDGNYFGYFTGPGTLVLAGIDLAIGSRP
jgi:hypothetical protein